MEEGSKKVSQKVKFLPRRFLVVASNGFQWKKVKKRGTEIVKFLPKIFLVVNTQSGRACVRTLQRQSNVWD